MRAAVLALVLLAWPALGCETSSNVSRDLGARCESADECGDRCLPPAEYPGGFCTTSCELNRDCERDAQCSGVEGGVCLFACTDDASCQFLGDGWRCQELALREDATKRAKVCAP